jgi:DtxR family Mn-dependent transcriptional regulator
VDPHGDPIPSKEGEVEIAEGTALSTVRVNLPHVILRVLLQDQERLYYLGTLGLYPGTEVTVLERAPFNGPLLINVGGVQHALAFEMAETLLVKESK